MLIDWFTVTAQIINFLILVALLKYFLYERIIQVMDKREKHIASRIAEAEEKNRKAEAEVAAYRYKQQQWEHEREKRLAQVKEEVEAERKKLLQQAREEIKILQERWYQALQQEKASFLRDLRQRTGKQVYAIARRVLTELANLEVEQRMIEVFLERLRHFEEHQWEAMVALFQQSDQDIVIRSAFDLPNTTRQKIRTILQERLKTPIRVRFEISSEVLCGIELRMPGQQIAWTMEYYLQTLETEIAQAFALESGKEISEHKREPRGKTESTARRG